MRSGLKCYFRGTDDAIGAEKIGIWEFELTNAQRSTNLKGIDDIISYVLVFINCEKHFYFQQKHLYVSKIIQIMQSYP